MSRKQKNITACFYLVIFCTICKNDIRKKVKNKVPPPARCWWRRPFFWCGGSRAWTFLCNCAWSYFMYESIYNVLKFEVVKNILLDVGVKILGWDIVFYLARMFCNLVFGILLYEKWELGGSGCGVREIGG